MQNLTSLVGLSHLTTLTSLNVSFNAIPQLKDIQAFPSLRSLNISHNRLISVQELTALSQTLTQLVCSSNRITSTDALVQLPGLQFLALHNNSISTAASVLALTQLSRLEHLTLRKNPVCKQDNWQAATIAVLPSLQVSSWDGVGSSWLRCCTRRTAHTLIHEPFLHSVGLLLTAVVFQRPSSYRCGVCCRPG